MNKKVINVLIVLIVLSLNSCAKRALMKYAEPEAVKECEGNFYRQFHTLVSNEEEKELKNIKTLSECREFQDKFWHIRDTDPTTPQNEYKEEKEKLAKDIENDALFQREGTRGFSFKGNGDFIGDVGKVYMLHGMPTFTEILENGRAYVDLMLWIYPDDRGNHKYRFLFYQRNDVGNFVLLRPNFDIFYGLNEINKTPTLIHPLDVYYELEREAKYIFLYSLVEFSDDLSMSIDKALRPPRPALEIAKELAPQIIGNEPEKEEVVISNSFGSLLPAELSYEFDNENLIVKVIIKHENLDWALKNNELTAELSVKTIIWFNEENHRHDEQQFDIVSTKEKIEKRNSTFLFELPLPLNMLEESTKISIFIKNNGKYNSWIEEIKR